MTAVPVLRTQLGTGSATAGDDCSALSIINAIRVVSGGKVGPKTQAQVAEWVRQVRQWGGAKLHGPDAGMLFRTQTLRAYRSKGMARAFNAAGLHAPKVGYFDRVPFRDGVVRSLDDGGVVHLPVNYGVLRRGDAPMGSTVFNGGHSLVLVGYRHNRRGQVLTRDGDPLFDGRRKGIPKGWRWTRAAYFADAAAAWTAGAGDLVSFIVIRRG